MPDFLSALQHFESGGQNIPNTHEGTSSGQAQGFNQITTGTWKEFGGLAYAPTPLQATREQQNAVAMNIPMRRWAPETLAYLQHSGLTVDPNRTLAGNIALNQGSVPAAPQGTTLNSIPMDPSIAARGGVSSTPGAPAPAAPTFAQNLGRGDVGAALAQLTANKTDASGKDQPGTSALSKLAGIAKPKEQAQQPSAPMLQAPEDSTTAIGPAAQQLLASTIAQASRPLHWATTAPGYGMAGPQVPGTTLNSGAPYV